MESRSPEPVSWIASTKAAVELAKDSSEAQRQIDELSDAQDTLADLLDELETLADSAKIIRHVGWPGRPAPPKLMSSLQAAMKTLDSRPLQTALRELERFTLEVRRDIVGAWKAHASNRVGNVNDLLVLTGTLAGVEGVSDSSRVLQQALGALAQQDDQLPTQRSLDLLDQVEKALQTLEESLQPESVRTFLSAVARGGASTQLLTKEVLAWLKAHDAFGSFRVVAGAPVSDANE